MVAAGGPLVKFIMKVSHLIKMDRWTVTWLTMFGKGVHKQNANWYIQMHAWACYTDPLEWLKQQTCIMPFPADTYSSYLLARITFTWGMRSTQQPSDKHGASVWRLKKENKETRVRWWLERWAQIKTSGFRVTLTLAANSHRIESTIKTSATQHECSEWWTVFFSYSVQKIVFIGVGSSQQ